MWVLAPRIAPDNFGGIIRRNQLNIVTGSGAGSGLQKFVANELIIAYF